MDLPAVAFRRRAGRAVKDSEHAEHGKTEEPERVYAEGLQRLLLEKAPAALALFDREMRYVAVSRRWRADFDLGDRELIGRSHYEVFPELSERLKAAHRRGLNGETVHSDEEPFERSDGTVQWLRWAVFPWHGADGKVAGIVIFSEDVTERRRAEQERETLARQRQVALDAARLGWWRYDAATREATWDDGYRRIFGVEDYARPNEEILARLIHPDDLPALRARVEAALHPADPLPFATEYRIRRPDGRTRWIEAHGVATFEGEGDARRAVELIGTVEDVTERRQAEDDLHAAHAQLRQFVDANIVGIVIARADGRILEANDYYLDLVGYSRDELARGDVDWRGMTPPEWLPADERAIAEMREEGRCTPYEKEYVRRDGTRVAVYLANAILPGAEERIAAFAVDVTARKRAERGLALVNLRLEELIEAVKALSQARTLDDVAAVVRAFARRLVGADGATFVLRRGGQCDFVDEDAIGPLWKGQRFPLEASVSGWTMARREAVVIPDVFRDERVPVDAYRSTFVKSLAMVPIGLGDPVGAIGVYWGSPHEATEEEVRLIQTLADASASALEVVRLLEELEARVAARTAELTAANRELEAFSYSVSHDLRAPLRAMDGFSRLLVEEHAASLDAEGGRLLGVVRESARRMSALIDDLLALSRLGRAEVHVRRVSMAPLVAVVLDEALAGEERGRWTVKVGELPDATGDSGLVRQVWANLLGNAVKFTRTRERPAIEVSASREGRLVAYCVKDNGVGFDMAYAGKLFGVFQRLHSPKDFAGTGVGLALVARILSRLGGTASGQGEVGVGATFTFTLPAAGEEG
jgi:PAS domain S-box-containing protein